MVGTNSSKQHFHIFYHLILSNFFISSIYFLFHSWISGENKQSQISSQTYISLFFLSFLIWHSWNRVKVGSKRWLEQIPATIPHMFRWAWNTIGIFTFSTISFFLIFYLLKLISNFTLEIQVRINNWGEMF